MSLHDKIFLTGFCVIISLISNTESFRTLYRNREQPRFEEDYNPDWDYYNDNNNDYHETTGRPIVSL